MNKQQVIQELRPISAGRLKSLLNKYLKDPQVGRKLGIFVDMDYLHTLRDNELREYVAEFLMEWRDYLNSNSKRRDLYNVYDKSVIGESTVEESLENIEKRSDAKKLAGWKAQWKNSYTLRDYMPSGQYSEDALINYIDYKYKGPGK